MTKPKPYKRYSAEFKKEAIRRASEEGNTDKAVCDELRRPAGGEDRVWVRYGAEVAGSRSRIFEVRIVAGTVSFQRASYYC